MSVLTLSSVFKPLELSHVSVKIVDCIGTTGTQPCLL